MLEIALILTEYDSRYEEIAFRFIEHFLWITYAMDRIGQNHDEMWDSEDGFFYDLLHFPNGDATRLKVRSMVGLLPLCASTVFESTAVENHPRLRELIELFRKRHPEVVKHIAPMDEKFIGYGGRRLLSTLNKEKLQRILGYMLDENEFLSPYGIRSLSRYHLDHPFLFHIDGQEYKVQYLPAESNTGMFGGNSNWRGPIWMPVNALIIRGLINLYPFYGDDFKVECPTGSGNYMTLFGVAKEIARRLSSIFLRDKRRTSSGVWRYEEIPGRSALAGLHFVQRVLPRRQWRRARCQPPDRLDGNHSPDDGLVRPHEPGGGVEDFQARTGESNDPTSGRR